MSRTIITHGCTQLMVTSILFRRRDAALLCAGAHHRHPVRHLLLGLVASPLVMWLGVTREDFIKPEKKQEEAVV